VGYSAASGPATCSALPMSYGDSSPVAERHRFASVSDSLGRIEHQRAERLVVRHPVHGRAWMGRPLGRRLAQWSQAGRAAGEHRRPRALSRRRRRVRTLRAVRRRPRTDGRGAHCSGRMRVRGGGPRGLVRDGVGVRPRGGFRLPKKPSKGVGADSSWSARESKTLPTMPLVIPLRLREIRLPIREGGT